MYALSGESLKARGGDVDVALPINTRLIESIDRQALLRFVCAR